MQVARAKCLGRSSCSVSKKDVGTLACSERIASGTDNVIITAACGDGKARRATDLRYEFELPAGVVRSAQANVSAVGYHALWCGAGAGLLTLGGALAPSPMPRLMWGWPAWG